MQTMTKWERTLSVPSFVSFFLGVNNSMSFWGSSDQAKRYSSSDFFNLMVL